MKFTDNPEITAANMDASDILAGTDTSAAADRKFTLSGLATWALSIFDGLSLAGAAQTVKAALDGLASRLTTVEAGTDTISQYAIETYTGTTLGGVAQTVKAAIDALNANTSQAVTVSTGGFTSTEYVNKHGKVIEFTYANGSDSAFSSFVAGEQICTIPAGYRPTHTLFFHGTARTAGSWTNSTIIPIALRIAADGTVTCFANQPNMRTCKYICVSMVYSIA